MGGAYINFMMDDEADGRLQATFGENYSRLVSIKTKYDPKNLFRVNQNIAPSGTRPAAHPPAARAGDARPQA